MTSNGPISQRRVTLEHRPALRELIYGPASPRKEDPVSFGTLSAGQNLLHRDQTLAWRSTDKRGKLKTDVGIKCNLCAAMSPDELLSGAAR